MKKGLIGGLKKCSILKESEKCTT